MAQPKKKTSHQKQHSRRAHWKAKLSNLGKNPQTLEPCLPHHAYIVDVGGRPVLYYNGRPVRKRDQLFES